MKRIVLYVSLLVLAYGSAWGNSITEFPAVQETMTISEVNISDLLVNNRLEESDSFSHVTPVSPLSSESLDAYLSSVDDEAPSLGETTSCKHHGHCNLHKRHKRHKHHNTYHNRHHKIHHKKHHAKHRIHPNPSPSPTPSPAPVPEPSTLSLLGLGLPSILYFTRKMKR